ncbi:MAG: nucleotidyl transferase AbiEii/AbiGii toxin family protein [Bacteroidetes bacterium]|nr:nucleotidyl transferase AbiEii/AbiGii toxin family protein [Bacteroidota bacterium]
MIVAVNSPEIQDFIRRHSQLFWYTPEEKKQDIDLEFLVETILNYGTMDDVRELIRILGHQEAARIFFSAEGRKKLNYFPEIYHYFSLYFSRSVQRDINTPYEIEVKCSFDGLSMIPELLDLAAMKAYALGRRSKWKDYVDLYFILKDHFSIDQITHQANDLFDQLFVEKLFHAQLSYFNDINYSEPVEFIGREIPPEEIREFLIDRALDI